MIRVSLQLMLVVLITVVALPVHSEIVRQNVVYKHKDTKLEGYLVYNDALAGKRSGVVVVHEWYGLTDHPRESAEQLAQMGYVAMAIDMYGQGRVAANNEEAAAMSRPFREDRELMRDRARAGMEILATHPKVDRSHVAAIGYCFGGTTVLELARSGAPLAGVVSFHGGLDTPDPDDARNIACPVLVLHGAEDPHVDRQEVQGFMEEMRKGDVDWQLVYFGGAVHSFTNPAAGDDPSDGAAYDPTSAERAWTYMKSFLVEVTSE